MFCVQVLTKGTFNLLVLWTCTVCVILSTSGGIVVICFEAFSPDRLCLPDASSGASLSLDILKTNPLSKWLLMSFCRADGRLRLAVLESLPLANRVKRSCSVALEWRNFRATSVKLVGSGFKNNILPICWQTDNFNNGHIYCLFYIMVFFFFFFLLNVRVWLFRKSYS